jgi:hypothetical protein
MAGERHGICEFALSITCFKCMSVALVIQQAKRIRRIILPSVALSRPSTISTYLTNGMIFGGKMLLSTKCVIWFSKQRLPKTFLFLLRTERDIMIHVHRSSCKYPLFLFDFYQTCKFLTYFRGKTSQNQILWKSVPWKPSFSIWADWRTHRQIREDTHNKNMQFFFRSSVKGPKIISA